MRILQFDGWDVATRFFVFIFSDQAREGSRRVGRCTGLSLSIGEDRRHFSN